MTEYGDTGVVDQVRDAQHHTTADNSRKFMDSKVAENRKNGWTMDVVGITDVNMYVEKNSWHSVGVINAGNELVDALKRADKEKGMGEFVRVETANEFVELLNKRHAMPTEEQRNTLVELQNAHTENMATVKIINGNKEVMYSTGDNLNVYDIARALGLDVEKVRDNNTLRVNLEHQFADYIGMSLHSVDAKNPDKGYEVLDKLTTEIQLAKKNGLGAELLSKYTLDQQETTLLDKLDGRDGEKDGIIHIRNDKGEMVQRDLSKMKLGDMKELLNNLKEQGVTAENIDLKQGDIQLKATANVIVDKNHGHTV